MGRFVRLIQVSLTCTVLVAVQLGPIRPLAPAASADSVYASDAAAMVNPFIGTANSGGTFPGADSPFGMLQWSPDTTSRPRGGGYAYGDSAITGFSLTHLSGTGCPAAGDVPILPTVGAVGSTPGSTTEPFSHSSEIATPGYYQVTAGGITTQLTTTSRAGLGQFTFPIGATQGNLLFKMSDSAAGFTSEQFQQVNSQEVAGSVSAGAFCGQADSYTIYFDVLFDEPFVTSGSWDTGSSGDWLSFDTTISNVVEAQVGVSYVSSANAALNRQTEVTTWDMADQSASAFAAWDTLLGQVQIAGGTPDQQTEFYTALYHCLLFPSISSDDNGQYMGADGQVHQLVSGQSAEYTNISGWDVYRGEVQLESMLAPTQASDIVTSILNEYQQTGEFPVWAYEGTQAYVMDGDPADAIIADAYAFGATNFDTATALSDMEQEAEVPGDVRTGLAYYLTDGYLPANGSYGLRGSVSAQLEYNVADSAIAQFATAIGQPSAGTPFATQAQSWQNVFDPSTGFMRPKQASGAFGPNFTPTSNKDFVEGNAILYTPSVPFDIEGLIAAEGGPANWISYLDQMTSSVTAEGPTQLQMNNEVSLDIPYEYDYAGAPYMTQDLVREIEDDLYTNSPSGLAGNDDLGALSAWYVWSALGFYPETPGSATVALGSPLFSVIAITSGDGNVISESAPAGRGRRSVCARRRARRSRLGQLVPAGQHL